ncbi:MAG: Glucose-responsive transcription factor [Cirrosporium novae-zelandiae]|nr:MAG: Glucose-responsive transcription factor [Cirrosporium novae-zelandiae]
MSASQSKIDSTPTTSSSNSALQGPKPTSPSPITTNPLDSTSKGQSTTDMSASEETKLDETMAPKQSYPSPNAAMNSGAPFYGNQNRISSPEALGRAEELALAHSLDQEINGASSSMPEENGGNHEPSMEMSAFHKLRSPFGGSVPEQLQTPVPANTQSPAQGQFHSPVPYGAPGSQQAISPTSNSSSGLDQPMKKKKKVSRACDNCRVKKMRCDASSQPGVIPCEQCDSLRVNCTYLRVPQKRGPNKGYIKDLERRLETLEGVMKTQGIQHGEGNQQAGNEHFVHTPEMQQHTSSLGFNQPLGFNPQQVNNQANQGFVDQSQLPHVGSGSRKRSISTILRDEVPQNHQPDSSTPWFRPPADPAQSVQLHQQIHQELQPDADFTALSNRDNFERLLQQRDTQGVQSTEQNLVIGDEENYFQQISEAMDRYYKTIHPFLPFLPELQDLPPRLFYDNPPLLRDAFKSALIAAYTADSSRTPQSLDEAGAAKDAADRLHEYEFAPLPTSNLNGVSTPNLVHLWILVLLSIYSDLSGPGALSGNSMPSRGRWLGDAIRRGRELNIHKIRSTTYLTGPSDAETNDNIARRIWLVLVSLDCWYSASAGGSPLVPVEQIRLNEDDKRLLGPIAYDFTKVSFTLGQLGQLAYGDQDRAEVIANPTTNTITIGILRNYQRFLAISPGQTGPTSKTLELAYQHVKLLLSCYDKLSNPLIVFDSARTLANGIIAHPTDILIIDHHLYSLTTAVLLILRKNGIKVDEITQLLRQLNDMIKTYQEKADDTRSDTNSSWLRAVASKIRQTIDMEANPQIPEPATAATNGDFKQEDSNGTLQHLATVAVRASDAPEMENSENGQAQTQTQHQPVDFSPVTNKGYLWYFA